MLNNNNHKSSCEFSAEMVSYLYEETSDADRGRFESHLADCGACTDEFAAISNTRFSVFEWQKEEFAGLQTPEMVMPYTTTVPVAESVGKAGILSSLRDLVMSFGRTATVAAAAALVVFAGLGFFAMTYPGPGGQQIAANNGENQQSMQQVDSPSSPITITPKDDLAVKPLTNSNGGVATSSSNKTSGRDVRPVRAAVENRRPKPERQWTAQTHKPVNDVSNRYSTHPKQKAPVLSGDSDDDDKSLRLSDLFDEVGAKL